MKKNLTRLPAIVLVICMALSYIVPATFAAETATEPVVYNFDQAANDIYRKLTDVSVALQGGQALIDHVTANSGKCTLGIMERYALDESEWAINWTYETASDAMRRSTTSENHLPSTNVRFIRDSGLRMVMAQDQWIAFRIKSPGAGTYAIDLSYYGYSGSGTVAFYILEAEGDASLDPATVLQRSAAIGAAMDPDNRVGMAELYKCSANASNSVFVGNWTFEENKEYILVAECYEEAPIPVNRYVYLTNLTMTAGEKTATEENLKDRIRTQVVKENVIKVADAGSMAAVWEMDGQDYYFLPIEGGQLLVFNLDTWELVQKVETGIAYPTSVAVLEKEDGTAELYITGNNKLMFRYNPYTGESFTTSQYNSVAGLEENFAVRGIDAHNGKVYLGLSYGGHLAEYDPATNTYKNLGDMIEAEFSAEEGEAGEISGSENGGITAIDCYGDYLYLIANSPDSNKLIKYDLVNGKKVAEVDATAQIGPSSGSSGLNVLGEGDYLIAGGIGFAGMVLVDLETMEPVTYAQALALGLDDNAWTYGMNQKATGVVETEDASGNKLYKQYFVAGGLVYAYNTQTKLFEKIGGSFNGFNVTGKQSVTLDRNKDGVEELYLFTFASGGQVRLCDPTVGKKISLNGLMKPEYGTGGANLRINTVDAGTLYMGAFNTPGCAAYNTQTGTFTDYQTMGQTDSQVWLDGKLYAGNYSACVVYQIDMANEDNNTPVISNMAAYEQKRIHTLTAGDGYVFAGTIPTTHTFGGGVGMYNTATGEESFLRFAQTPANGEKVVPAALWNQSVKGLVYQGELLYGCTTRSGGTGAGHSKDTSALIFVMDYKNSDNDAEAMEILATLDLREYIPEYLPSTTVTNNDGSTSSKVSPISFIGGITADPVVEGRFWGLVSEVLFTFAYDRDTKQWDVQVVHDYKHTEYLTSGNRSSFNVPVVFDPDHNSVYVSFASGSLQRVTLKDWNTAEKEAYEQVMGTAPIFYAMGADNMLYYASGADLKALAINVTAEDWAIAQAWDAQVKAIGEVTPASASAIQAARTAYEDLSLRDKALVQELAMLEEAEAELLEQLITAEAGGVSAESVEILEGYIARYDSMTARQQRYVKNRTVLTEAYEAAVELRENEAIAAAQVQEQINALTVTSFADAAAVTAARAAYAALNDRQKALVDIAALTAAEEQLAALTDAVQAVQGQIDALPEEVTLADQTAILAAREAYDALSDGIKSEVDIKKLEAAEEKLAKLLQEARELQIYDFKLYNNASYMDYVKERIIEKGAPEDVVLTNHNLYKYSYTTAISYVSPYMWFSSNYPGAINWAPEGSNSAATDPGKDYNLMIASQTGMRLNFEKPSAAAIKQDFAAFRIQVLDAGTYQMDLTLFEGSDSGRLATGDVLDFYIFPAYEEYSLNKDNYTQIAPYLTDTYYAGSLTYTTQANAGDTSTYTISQAYTFPAAGDYIIVVRENANSTCRYLYLDTLTLRENVEEAEAVAEVDGKYFRTVENALEYQVLSGADSASLVANAQAKKLILQPGAVLDLNGYALKANSVEAAPAALVVDSTENNGVLCADVLTLNENNPQLPVYDPTAGGYRFFEVTVSSVAITGKNSANPKYWFKISIDNFEQLNALIQTGDELDIAVKMSWANGGAADATAGAEFLKKWAEKYAAGGDFYITVSAVNTEGLGDFSLIPCMVANGVAICGDDM